jgi:hypothetical protein
MRLLVRLGYTEGGGNIAECFFLKKIGDIGTFGYVGTGIQFLLK